VIPTSFEYVRAGSVDEALALLVEHGDEAKLLAGGHSLLPLMKFRLATPTVLVDIGRIGELSYIRAASSHVEIGATTRHHDLETSEVLAELVPALAHVAGEVGDPQVRHRGTIGGSIVHGDPASDLPAALLALDASLLLRGPAGERDVPANEFFVDFLETAIAPDEILTEIRVPIAPGGFGFQKFNRRAMDWAIVGALVTTTEAGPRIALVNMATTPIRASASEAALLAGSSVVAAAGLAAEGTTPPADLSASSDYRRHLARVLTRRALELAAV
jgi:carbon-monoxide dehydrogenase medium subunit